MCSIERDRNHRYFSKVSIPFRKSQCRWYRVFSIGIGSPLLITYEYPLKAILFPVSIDDDVLQWLPPKRHFSHICHDFPSLGIASTAHVVGWVGRVQNKWWAVWKKHNINESNITPQASLTTDIIYINKGAFL